MFQCKNSRIRKIKPEKKYILPSRESFTVHHQEKHQNTLETEINIELPSATQKHNVTRHNTISPVSSFHINNCGKYSNTIEEYMLNSNPNSFYIYD
jgi:hypothetical protein